MEAWRQNVGGFGAMLSSVNNDGRVELGMIRKSNDGSELGQQQAIDGRKQRVEEMHKVLQGSISSLRRKS
jgi:hypothetical protein